MSAAPCSLAPGPTSSSPLDSPEAKQLVREVHWSNLKVGHLEERPAPNPFGRQEEHGAHDLEES